MNNIKTDIIPKKIIFTGEQKTLDLKAICTFAALGFFLDDDTYYKEQKVLKPARNYVLDQNNKIVSEKSYFNWHYKPNNRSLQDITEEFASLFEQILREQSQNKKVILPLSGGLDSRTQACGLHHVGAQINSYSYSFTAGHNEALYSEKIAKVCGFPFQSWKIPQGYLWSKIEQLAEINGCYSEFTHPRQMAFIERYASLGDVFSLGHLGDLLFDDMGVADNLPIEKQIEVLYKKVIKKGGLELATSLWETWGLDGNFNDYLYERLKALLLNINIPESANAQIRAFKSLTWVPRWTNTNLLIFEHERPIELPYYDNRMCEFICTVPEKYLAGRQIQIEYLKMRNPKLAKITWQSKKPFNLYNYHLNKIPYNLPYRIVDKAKRSISPKKYIQRNWELQFVGAENEQHLKNWLFENKKMNEFIPKNITTEFYNKFLNQDSLNFSHSVSMLLTLSLFCHQNK